MPRTLRLVLTLVVAAALAVVATGCAHVTERRTPIGVASRHLERGEPVRDPGHDQLHARARLEGDDLLVEVARTEACVAPVRERVVERVKVERELDDTIYVEEALVVGAEIAMWAVVGSMMSSDKHTLAGVDAEGDVDRTWLAVDAIGIVGFGAEVATVVDWIRAIDGEETKEVVRDLDEDSFPCATVPARGSVIARLPDGSEREAPTDAAGRARLAIDEETWARFGDELRVELLLDGAKVGRVRVRR